MPSTPVSLFSSTYARSLPIRKFFASGSELTLYLHFRYFSLSLVARESHLLAFQGRWPTPLALEPLSAYAREVHVGPRAAFPWLLSSKYALFDSGPYWLTVVGSDVRLPIQALDLFLALGAALPNFWVRTLCDASFMSHFPLILETYVSVSGCTLYIM